MTTRIGTTWAAVALLTLGGCVNLAPPHERPEVALSPAAGLSTAAGTPTAAPVALPGWRELVRDERLRRVVELALAHNPDGRIAALSVEKTRAQLRLTDADRWPTVNAAFIGSRAPNSSGVQTTTLQAGLQVSAWELDLFGRLANASDAANAAWLASEAAERSTRLALVAQTITAWLTLAADTEQLTLAQRTLSDREKTHELSALRFQVGPGPARATRGRARPPPPDPLEGRRRRPEPTRLVRCRALPRHCRTGAGAGAAGGDAQPRGALQSAGRG
ncbi:multidrug transporter [Vitreoscilla filiformis]|uniref:Multidrug transporter n=1 Tax=Vitreoscilla filiformis TaxID=63 RepID=A0A221KBR6_VITFI|nr:TolC family protein [Vitreoscilla filiformis]ASM76277.1 multidrug transporter [Vitreoscilla filiformis]